MKTVIILFSLLILISFTSGGFGYNNLDGPIMVPPINYSDLPTVNSTDWWNTNLGSLSDVNAANFDNVGDTLTIDTAWVDSMWCSLSGCEMSGNINMAGGDIYNVNYINGTTGNFTDLYVSNNSLFIGDKISLSVNKTNLQINGGNVSAEIYFGSGEYLTDLNLTNISFSGDTINASVFNGINLSLSGYLKLGILENVLQFFEGNNLIFKSINSSSNFNITNFLNVHTDGSLHVGPDTRGVRQFMINPGDFYVGADSIFNGGINVFSRQFGTSLTLHNYDSAPYLFSLGATANVNGTTQILCDTTDPFNSSFDGKVVTILSSTPSFEDATAEIEEVINSSCILLSFCSTNGYEIADATDATYVIFPHPAGMFLDNGCFSFEVGNNPDAKWEVHGPNGTGQHLFLLEDKAATNGRQTMSIETDVNGYEGINALNLLLYTSSAFSNKEATVLNLQADGSNINFSKAFFINAELLAPGTNSTSTLIKADPNIDALIEVGSADILDAAWTVNTTGPFNATSGFKTDGVDIPSFQEDDSYIMIGNAINFTTMSFSLSAGSSQEITPVYYYCNNTGGYSILVINSDTTNGFKESGSISFDSPTDRGKCNTMLNGTSLPDAGLYSYIVVQRTRNAIFPTTPIINTVTISGASNNFLLTKDVMRINPVDTAPLSCPTYLGAMYFDISEDGYCQCKSGGWFVMEDGSPCT